MSYNKHRADYIKIMLYLNVKRVMHLRGIENHNQFIIKLGFAPATARKMLRGEHWRIDVAHIERLCLALKCTPNDLLEWQPPENNANPGAEALNKLRHGENDLTKLLGSLPLEKLDEAASILRGLKDK